jgi:hypothetical protein
LFMTFKSSPLLFVFPYIRSQIYLYSFIHYHTSS